MKRWTNGLPGATKRLGAMMAQRGLSASQPRMRADTHDGPEQMLHLRGLIHCCSSHVRRSWSFCLATHGPGHTFWHLSDMPMGTENVCLLGRTGSSRRMVETTRLTHSGHCDGDGHAPVLTNRLDPLL